MSKLPALQFYPADWRKDPGIQALSFEDRGIWFEILCLMHESPQRGLLLLPNRAPISCSALARILGLPENRLAKALDRIADVGVSDRDEETGALKNRRMVRDEHIRQVRTHAGKLGGNPDLLKQKSTKPPKNDNQTVNQIPTPSSSSSSSTTVNTPRKPPKFVATEKLFSELWEKYPNRDGRKAALRHFRVDVKTATDWQNIQAALENYVQTRNRQNSIRTHDPIPWKGGDTWFNNWRDWIPQKTGPMCMCCGGGHDLNDCPVQAAELAEIEKRKAELEHSTQA